MTLPAKSFRAREDDPPTIEGGPGALWNPEGGPQLYHDEPPHIWQEYKLFRESGLRPIRGAPPWGAHWWILPVAIGVAIIAVVFEPARALLTALRSLL